MVQPLKPVMAGLDPAIQMPQATESFRRADARRLDGCLKGGHDERKRLP